MTSERTPRSFPIQPDAAEKPTSELGRRPRALSGDDLSDVIPAEIDIFEQDMPVAEVRRPRSRIRLGRIFVSALALLFGLAISVWIDALVRELFMRADWLGWTALAGAITAALALFAIVLREYLSLRRLTAVETLRNDGAEAIRIGTLKAARDYTGRLAAFLSVRPETASGRAKLKALDDDVMDGSDLVRIAEIELVGPLDAQARLLIMAAAKRVSVVTAVSPRAIVDVAYILFETGRLVRRLAELYGTRPGTLGYVRLVKNVLAHLAVTGVMAVGDEFVHQVVGQGLAARISAKLGEGVVNGVMTVRVGLAAMEVVRPLPFTALRRPRVSDFVTALANVTRAQHSNGPRDK